MRLIVGITGATGAIYGIRLMEVLSGISSVETHLVVSKVGGDNIESETGWTVDRVKALATRTYDVEDVGAPLASGSFKTDGMIIAPCTVKTMSALANSYTENLIIRAGDVTLKERRRLVVLFRETPLNLGHLRNMARVTEMGAIVLPPVPAFYHRPKSIQDIVDQTVGKVLDLFGVEHDLYRRWDGAVPVEL